MLREPRKLQPDGPLGLYADFTFYLDSFKYNIHTLYRRVDGSTKSKGHPLIFMMPFPRLQKATAVAVF